MSRILLLVAAFVCGAGPLTGQGGPASARPLGLAGGGLALYRGIDAVAENPARLGHPDRDRAEYGLLSVQIRAGLDPISLGRIDDFEGRRIPAETREEWLQEIGRDGSLVGTASAGLNAITVQWREWGLQIASRGVASVDLNEDAAELLLFGNAGRTGEPREFDLDGSSIQASWISTAALSYGRPVALDLGRWTPDRITAGARFTYSQGHFLLVGQDVGSILLDDPAEIELRFPLVQTDTAFSRFDNGGGMGLDVAVAVDEGRWSGSLVLQNVFNTFGWDPSELFFRRGEAFFDVSDSDSDFDPRPFEEAPASLRSGVERLEFDPRVRLGAAYRRSERVVLTGDLAHTFGRGNPGVPRNLLGFGGEYLLREWARLRSGLSWVTGSVRFAAGGGLDWGRVRFAAAGQLQWGEEGNQQAGSLSVTLRTSEPPR